jgi:hypothetical protein
VRDDEQCCLGLSTRTHVVKRTDRVKARSLSQIMATKFTRDQRVNLPEALRNC